MALIDTDKQAEQLVRCRRSETQLMRPHGEFTLKADHGVVHTYPVGGFNDTGIMNYRQAILQQVAGRRDWVLFEHPQNIAWLTPEAVDGLVFAYDAFARKGCRGIAVEVSSVYQMVLEEQVFGRVTVPIKANDDVVALTAFLRQILAAADGESSV